MYTRVMVPLDGSEFAEAALSHASALAARWGAMLDLVTVPLPEFNAAEAAVEDATGRAVDERSGVGSPEAYLDAALRRLGEAGFHGEADTSVTAEGEATPRLLDHLSATRADFVVMTTHGRGPIRRAWLGSTADAFIRQSPVPVLLIPPQEEVAEGTVGGRSTELPAAAGSFQRIVIPLDGSADAEGMLERAAPLAAGPEAEYLLLRAVPPFIPGGSPYLPNVVRGEPDQSLVHEAARKYLEGLAPRFPAGRVVTRVVTVAQPALGILDLVEEVGADLIAMPMSGRGGFARLLLGSIADKVIRGAHVPVLVYRRVDAG